MEFSGHLRKESELTNSDPEEGTGNFTEISSVAPSDDHDYVSVTSSTVPERKLRRSAATRALHGLVLHVFRIEKNGKVAPVEDSYSGLNEALTTETVAAASTKKQLNQIPSYWVDIDADERDRTELNDWIDRLDLGSFVTDQLTKPAEGMKEAAGRSFDVGRHCV